MKRRLTSLPLQLLIFVILPLLVLLVVVAFGGVALHQAEMCGQCDTRAQESRWCAGCECKRRSERATVITVPGVSRDSLIAAVEQAGYGVVNAEGDEALQDAEQAAREAGLIGFTVRAGVRPDSSGLTPSPKARHTPNCALFLRHEAAKIN